MANPLKFKSVSVPIDTYKKLNFLADNKVTDAHLTISKGNGFIRISKDSFSEVKQCKHCDSEGVMRIDEPAVEELEQMADVARLQ